MHRPAGDGSAPICKARTLVEFSKGKHQEDLLWIPNSGKIPPKEDRVKLLAASALAANVGYASTKNVKIPEYTRIVLEVTRRISITISKSQVARDCETGGVVCQVGFNDGSYPAPKTALPMIGAIQWTSG